MPLPVELLPPVLTVLAVTFFFTSLLLTLYLWKVEKLMRLLRPLGGPGADTSGGAEGGAGRDFPSEHYDCDTPPGELLGGSPTLGPPARFARKSAALIYFLAGLAHAFTALLILLLIAGPAVAPGHVFTLTSGLAAIAGVALLWPALETHFTLSVAPILKKAAAFAVYLAAVWATTYINLHGTGFPVWESAAAMLLLVSAPTLAKWAVMNAWLKAAGATVLVVCSAVAGGLLAAAWFGRAVGAGPLLSCVLGVHIVAGAFGVGWLSVKWLVRRHVGKVASDQTIILDIYWLMLTEWLAYVLVVAFDDWRGLLAAFAFAGYALVLTVGFRVRSRLMRGAPGNVRLLLLRTFTKGAAAARPGEAPAPGGGRAGWFALSLRRVFGGDGGRLIRSLETRWRYIGSIQLIAGPDLASAYVDVDEFVDWARGRLDERFIQTGEDLERRLQSMDLAPDRDGRYRVNEFFCGDKMWGGALARLINPEKAPLHAVLMDLRGFSKANEGVTYELGQLVDKVALERVVFVVDGKTDSGYLDAVLKGSWASMAAKSPNRRATEPSLRFFHVGRRDGRAAPRLCALLLRAAEEGAAVDTAAAHGARVGAGVTVGREAATVK